MIVSVRPSKLVGKVDLPYSKSLIHRFLIAEFLSGNLSRPYNICDDAEATFNALKAIKNGGTIYAENSASTLRFLLPLSLVFNESSEFILGSSLKKRPVDFIINTFNGAGISVIKNDDVLSASGRLKPGRYVADASVSSQLVSGLLFSLPLLDGDSELIIKGEVVSSPYISMTLDVLEKYSVCIKREGNSFYIKGGQKYISATWEIEKDYSSYALFAVLNKLGNSIECPGLIENSVQGDSMIDKYLESDEDTFDMKDNIDLCPVLAVYLASKNGDVCLTGVKNLVHKESNREEETVKLLDAFSVRSEYTEENGGTLIIHGTGLKPLKYYSSDDHRMVMAAIVGALTVGGEIGGAECVSKSYPDFIKDIIKIGADINVR
ncbi:MAG: hypothetical protein MJ068_03560 [Clostridia bacterium]|nr:hypothetical protein [Clostridia bacterium]